MCRALSITLSSQSVCVCVPTRKSVIELALDQMWLATLLVFMKRETFLRWFSSRLSDKKLHKFIQGERCFLFFVAPYGLARTRET